MLVVVLVVLVLVVVVMVLVVVGGLVVVDATSRCIQLWTCTRSASSETAVGMCVREVLGRWGECVYVRERC